MRAEVAADTGAEPDRHIMSQRLPDCLKADRTRWSSAGNGDARPRPRNRYGYTRDIKVMRGASIRETAVTALPGQRDMEASRRAKPTVGTSARAQSP